MSYRVLISDAMAKEAVDILEKEKGLKVDVNTKLTPEQLKDAIKDYDALLVRSATKVSKDIINAGSKLKIIGRAGVGLDNVDLEAASKKGIIVVNTPGGNTVSTAELAFTLMTSLSRNIGLADASMKRGEWEKKKFMGSELYRKTLGIVGLGRIGTEVAKRALSFEMRVLAFDPYLSMEKAKQLGVESVDLNTIYKEADYITVHTPLTDDTKHLISDAQFAMMKKGIRLMNCARGGIIDEEALVRAIESGKVAGAALDVFETEPLPADSKLRKVEKLLLTPHLGASTEEAQVNVAIDIANTVIDVLIKSCIRNAVNVPCVDAEILKVIKPYLELCEKIGLIHAQMADGHVKRVKVKYMGDILRYDLTPLTLSIVKGLLTPILQETVNFVNAQVIAKERGINIVEMKTAEVQDYTSSVSVEIETDKGTNTIEGTLFTKVDPRIVRINEFYVDAVPEGNMLVIFNKDVPGIIGQIGTLLGKNKINIAGMSFGRVEKAGKAITVLNVDGEVTKSVLDEIKKADNVQEAKLVKL